MIASLKKALLVIAALTLLGGAIFGVMLWKTTDATVTMNVPANVPPTWAKVRTSPGHTKHLTSKKPAVCRDCHDDSDGGFVAVGEAACTKCHEPEVKITHVDRKSTRLNSSHERRSRMPSSA